MVSCGRYPALLWAAASPHEVQPPLEQPPVETAAPALTIGNGRLVLRAVSVKSILPAFSAAAARTTSWYLAPPSQYAQSPCGGTGRSRVWARRCVTWQK